MASKRTPSSSPEETVPPTASGGAVLTGGSRLKRLLAYVKANWKVFLALLFAAVPALYILLSSSGRKQAQQVLQLQPAGASMSGAAPNATIPSAPAATASTPATAVVAAAAAPVRAVANVLGGSGGGYKSIDGHNPTPPPPVPPKPLPPSVQRQASLQQPATTKKSTPPVVTLATPHPTYGRVDVTGGSPTSIRNKGLEG